MSVIVEEKWDGRRQAIADQPSQEVSYLIFGTADDSIARSSMVSASPTFWPIDGVPIPRNSSEIVQRLTPTIWEGKVNYGWGAPPEEGEQLISFDTTGGTQKIYASYQTMGKYGLPGYLIPDFKGAIGVSENGVEGVDVPAPALSFSIQQRYDPAFVTLAWTKLVASITGCYNAAPYLGYDTCELRFDGATGQQRNGKPWDITFKFTASQNATGLTIGGITGIAKRGWDYLWLRFKKQADTTAKALVKVPVSAYVEQVLLPADFTALGIGTS